MYKCTHVYVHFVIGLLLLWSWLIKHSGLNLALFSPVPAKLVSQIVAGKYVDLCDLLPANLHVKEPEPQLQLFNFHAAGASVRSPSSNDSSD